MNWIMVVFDGIRTVYANGAALGDTNQILFLGEDGTYTIDLGEPVNYEPPRVIKQISGSSRENPDVLHFFI